MAVFLLRRVLQSLIVILLVTVITFGLLRMIPGNPAVAVLGPSRSETRQRSAQFDRQLRLRPALVQPVLALAGPPAAPGNLGYSWKLNQSVASLLAPSCPRPIFLVGDLHHPGADRRHAGRACIQAVRRNKFADHFFNGFSTVFYAMPAFLLGILLILVFAIKLPMFPPEGPQGEGLGVLFTDFNALILPIISLTLITIALFSRYMRSAVLDNLTEDYVRTAQGQGSQ